ncbi:MAG TPA: hypothetical protein VIK72_05530 [Clostridiaceae bacterium]
MDFLPKPPNEEATECDLSNYKVIKKAFYFPYIITEMHKIFNNLRRRERLLKEQMQGVLNMLGLNIIKHPIFYNCHNGIRFEIGLGEVYGNDMKPRKEYIENALSRAITIYNNGIRCPAILMWEVYPQNDKEKKVLKFFLQKKLHQSCHRKNPLKK